MKAQLSCLLLSCIGFLHVLGKQCNAPIQKKLQFGCETARSLADKICCHNTDYAEHSGFFTDPKIGLFGKLNPDKTTTFYDSVCGLPLFIAPRGRSFAEWHSESLQHGWPSFRPEEAVKANIVFHEGGEMASTCGTHLGHNLPDSTGDRYCIDLVCIAGNKAGSAMQDTNSIQHPKLRRHRHHRHGNALVSLHPVHTVWFGDGCFWATQKALVNEEIKLGRDARSITSLAGYAGGLHEGSGPVCYYGDSAADRTYSTLGFAEAVSIQLDPGHKSQDQFTAIAQTYFSLFDGTMRPDQMGDGGPAYRSSIGIPGGINGPFFAVVQKENVNGLKLQEGQGADADTSGTVWIYDSDRFRFHQAEAYHQFYDSAPELKAVQVHSGRVKPIDGCHERS
jgi:peptide methionine sulfoxide reductase MsrA/peptide methionine sulfoxide reductase MsrB